MVFYYHITRNFHMGVHDVIIVQGTLPNKYLACAPIGIEPSHQQKAKFNFR